MVEYAVLLSSLALFSSSLSGLEQSVAANVTASDVVALRQAVQRAGAAHRSATGARAAYARAPYRLPALRYVYVNGWIAGTKRRTECALSLIDPAGLRSDLAKGITRDASLRRQLRRMRLTAAQAATAYARGFLSACGGR